MFYTWKYKFVLFLSHFLVNISIAIDKFVSMLFLQRRGNADEHTLVQLSFSTKYQRWNNIGLSALNRHNSFNLVSMLFCQRWNNVDKHTSAQLSFSTKIQCWNKIGSSTLNRRNAIELFQRCFANVETTSINVCWLNFHFQPNMNVETTLMNVDDESCSNVDSTLMCLLGMLKSF